MSIISKPLSVEPPLTSSVMLTIGIPHMTILCFFCKFKCEKPFFLVVKNFWHFSVMFGFWVDLYAVFLADEYFFNVCPHFFVFDCDFFVFAVVCLELIFVIFGSVVFVFGLIGYWFRSLYLGCMVSLSFYIGVICFISSVLSFIFWIGRNKYWFQSPLFVLLCWVFSSFLV